MERVASIGPQAYIDEQLNMDGIPETIDNYTVETTNAVPFDPSTNWTYVTLTGTVASTTFYLFTTQPGDMYIDDIQLLPNKYFQNIVTNQVNGTNVYTTNRVFSHVGTNILINGQFESALTPWTVAGGHVGSGIAPRHAFRRQFASCGFHDRRQRTGSSYAWQVFSNSYAAPTATETRFLHLRDHRSGDAELLYLPTAYLQTAPVVGQRFEQHARRIRRHRRGHTWRLAATSTPQLYLYLSAG
jgi:hypothetical protein